MKETQADQTFFWDPGCQEEGQSRLFGEKKHYPGAIVGLILWAGINDV